MRERDRESVWILVDMPDLSQWDCSQANIVTELPFPLTWSPTYPNGIVARLSHKVLR